MKKAYRWAYRAAGTGWDPLWWALTFVGRALLCLFFGLAFLGLPGAAGDQILNWLGQNFGFAGFALVAIGLIWSCYIYVKPRDVNRNSKQQLEKTEHELSRLTQSTVYEVDHVSDFSRQFWFEEKNRLEYDIKKYNSWTWKILSWFSAAVISVIGVALIIKAYAEDPDIHIANLSDAYPMLILVLLQARFSWNPKGVLSIAPFRRGANGAPIFFAIATLLCIQHFRFTLSEQAWTSVLVFLGVAHLGRQQEKP